MGLISNWFKRKGDSASAPSTSGQSTLDAIPPPQRTIRYDAELVGGLKHDHSGLVAMYARLGDTARSGGYHEINGALQAFKTRLEAHLLTENVRFYVYLEQSMANDADNMALIKDFRREMNAIARGVVEFVRRYQGEPVTAANQVAFLRDYGEVGKLLAQRIEREENHLYPLYQP